MSTKRKYDRHGRLLYSCSHCGNAKPGRYFSVNSAKIGPDWKRQPVCDACWHSVHPNTADILPFRLVEAYRVFDAPVPGCAGQPFLYYRVQFEGYPELRGWVAGATEAEVRDMLSRICSSSHRKRCRPADSRHYIAQDETELTSAYTGRSPAHV